MIATVFSLKKIKIKIVILFSCRHDAQGLPTGFLCFCRPAKQDDHNNTLKMSITIPVDLLN